MNSTPIITCNSVPPNIDGSYHNHERAGAASSSTSDNSTRTHASQPLDGSQQEASGHDIPGAGAPHHSVESSDPTTNITSVRSLRCISANVRKTSDNLSSLLEKNPDADVIFVQEPFKGMIKIVSSTKNPEGDQYHHTSAHRNFLCLGYSEDTRVLMYINRRWQKASPQLRTASVQHNDTMCVTMQIAGEELTFLNVYNDSKKFYAVPYLLDRVELLPKITVMAGDFNLRDPLWDRGERLFGAPRSRHNEQREQLIELAKEQLGLTLLNEPDGEPTWLADSAFRRDGVIDLVWVDPERGTLDGLKVDEEERMGSDHAILRWELPINGEEEGPMPSVKRGSKEGAAYVKACRSLLDAMPFEYESREHVEGIGNLVGERLGDLWKQHATIPKRSRHSKSWWSRECSTWVKETRELKARRKELGLERKRWQTNLARVDPNSNVTRQQTIIRLTVEIASVTLHIDQANKRLRGAIRRAKRDFFDEAIAKVHSSRIWDLVEWTKPRKLSATTGLVDREGRPIDRPEKLAEAFQEQFTPTNPRQVDMSILDEIPQQEERTFSPITEREIREALSDTSNFSAPGPDNLSWFWLKRIITDLSDCECGSPEHAGQHTNIEARVAAYYNACIQYAIHPTIFKKSRTVVIPKPNKPDYSKAKAYRPIVLLNCLGKLMEKVIARRMQFDAQKYGLMHACQFGGAMQHSTQDAGIQLVHEIQQAWKRQVDSSALLLDVAQFFPSVNHEMLSEILRRHGFDRNLCAYFCDYLIGRQTEFLFNGHQSEPTDFSTGVGQGSALSPILTGLYIAPVLHLIAPAGEVLEGNATLQFFVDDGMIHVAGKQANDDRRSGLTYNNSLLEKLFGDVVTNLGRLGLGVEVDKLELMHFRRAKDKVWSQEEPLGPKLTLNVDGHAYTVVPQEKMRYLGFFLDPKLSFREHIRFYSTKSSSTVQALRMLGNSVRGLTPKDKRRLYISNVLPILTYGAQLWWHPSWKGRKWIASELQKTQNKAARWITGAFRTTPIGALEMIAGLFPIKHQIDKYMKKACLRTRLLHKGHPTRAHLMRPWAVNKHNIKAPMPLTGKVSKDGTTPMTHINILGQSSTETFDVLHNECKPGERLLDMFASRVVCHLDNIGGITAPPKSRKDELSDWIRTKLNPLIEGIERDQASAIVFTDGSQKKNGGPTGKVAAGAAWLVRVGGVVTRGRFGCGQATPYDAEMAALACGLRKAVDRIPESVTDIHVFADNQAALTSILAAGHGPAQLTSVAACASVRKWLEASPDHQIHLWWCPGHMGVHWNNEVDREAGLATAEPCEEVSFAYARQRITAQAYDAWRQDMQGSSYRGQNSLIQSTDFEKCKHSSANWFIRTAGKSNTYLARLSRFVSGHFPHGSFRERFNFEGNQSCLCGKAAVETRDHIWFDCELWIRKHKPPDMNERQRTPEGGRRRDALDLRPPTPPGMTWKEHILAEWRETPPDLEDVAEFLRLNPVVGTFQWLELVDQAMADRERGETNSIALLKTELHTRIRKRAHTRWTQAFPRGTLTEFNTKFARTALDLIESRHTLGDAGRIQTLVEFGVSPATAKKLLRDETQRRRPRPQDG